MLRDEPARLSVSPARQQRLCWRINGIVGGILSKDERAQSEEQALAIVHHRLEDEDDPDGPQLRRLLASHGFGLYVRRKVAAWVSGLAER